jgi:hypothetical protein
MRTVWLFGFLLLAVAALGCIGAAEEQPPAETDDTTPSVPGPAPGVQEAPVYDAPLNGSKIRLDCQADEDCKLIRYRTGVGINEQCVADRSEYEGIETDDCTCKSLGYRTTFINNTETQVEQFECRHV